MHYSAKRIIIAFREIHDMADRINLSSSIIDRAKALFMKIRFEYKLKGWGYDTIVSACLYIACRQEQVPRTFKEICAISNVNKRDIGRCFKVIMKILEPLDVITSNDFMPRFCANLDLSYEVQRTAMHIAKKATDLYIVPGRSPISVAGAAIYMASQVC